MPSPFPGMDPFIEGQMWKGFHTSFLAVLRDLLVLQLRPRYVVQIEEYVWLSHEELVSDRFCEADPAFMDQPEDATKEFGTPTSAASVGEQAKSTLPVLRRRRQRFIAICSSEGRKVVTVVEILSPANKAACEGREAYLTRRAGILGAQTNLVEIDLLRGGLRSVPQDLLPRANYFALIYRWQEPSKACVFASTMRARLPIVPVPLAPGEPDISLDLQEAFTLTYDRAGYDYALDYRAAVDPPLEPAVAEWVHSVLSEKKLV